MTTAVPDKRLVRIALAIHARLAAGQARQYLPELPTSAWENCRQLVRRVRRAEARDWPHAAGELRFELRYALGTLSGALAELKQRLEATDTCGIATTARDVYADLVELDDEFAAVSFDGRALELAVRTEPIELGGLELGPFEIRLDTRQLAAGSAYRITALEPNPCTMRPEVTHPHVLDGQLCEGEGRQAIRRALAAGRLYDFFQLVASVLRTYNDESPFVALEDWHGRACSDCGHVTEEEEGLSCATCGDWVCAECEVSCGDCGDGNCTHCLASCRCCEDSYCRGCLKQCPGCAQSVCSHCLFEDERCPHCHEDDSDDGTADDDPAASADAAVHSHRLGQTAVSA